MKKIRRGVFESNSSSTHSLSISDNRKRVVSDIPKDSKVIINDSYPKNVEIFDELGKLNFVVTMLASIVEGKYDEGELEIESFEEMVNLNWFKWLAEAIKEESNTDIVYECPMSFKGVPTSWVPYYDTTYDEDESVEEIFTGYSSEVMNNVEKFKERVKDIIYNPAITIENKENEY